MLFKTEPLQEIFFGTLCYSECQNMIFVFQNDLSNMTWHEVQTKLLDVQKEQQMCIHKTELTQLGNDST